MMWLCLWLATVGGVTGQLPLRAATPEEHHLAELRSQGKYEQAEKYCIGRLAEPDIATALRVTLAIELSRIYAEHAMQSAANARPALWQAARRTADDFATRFPREPRLPLVQMQAALAALAEGESIREDAELGGNQPAELVAARASLRDAIKQLRDLDESVAAEIRQRGRGARGESRDALSVAELSSLELHIRYQLARALRNQGLCYAADSADRLNSLGQASELLSALTRHELTPQFAWSVRLDEIAVLRLIGNYRDAEKKLAQADRLLPAVESASQVRAERIRIALARGRVDEALSEAGSPGIKSKGSPPEANLAQLEAYVAAWQREQQARNKTGAARWEQAAIEQVRAIQQADGPAVAARAETTLARAMAGSQGSDNPQVLLLAAQSLYRAGRLDEALAAYERAATRAAAVGDKNTYFDSRYAAGALATERQQFPRAVELLRKLALTLPQHERAAGAHLLAVHAAAQAARQHDPPRLDAYKQLLREHVESWPASATVSQAWWWLGRVDEHDRNWQEAVRALKNVKPDDEHYAEAVAAIGRCYEGVLDDMRGRGNANDLLAGDAIALLLGVVKHARRTSQVQAEAARNAVLAMARIYLKEMPSGAAQAERLLSESLRSDSSAPDPWRRQAQLLLVPALAATGQAAAAERLLKQLPIGSVEESVVLAELLLVVKRRATSDDKLAVARVELAVIGDVLAKPEGLDSATIKNLARQQVDTLVDLDDSARALAALGKLAGQYPRDGQLQENLARLLSDSDDPASQQAALLKWRDVAGHCRPGSERWFRAHLALARLQLAAGEPSQARATIRLVESSQPELGGPETKAQFRQLLAECDRASDPRNARKK
jgi:tetratricopeptide (TPR) repeat protein